MARPTEIPSAANHATPSGVLRNLAKRLRLVGPRLRRKPEHPLAEDVALHLLGTTTDANAPLPEELLLPEAFVVGVARVEHPRRALDREGEVTVDRHLL